jgi:G3E family GTPase
METTKPAVQEIDTVCKTTIIAGFLGSGKTTLLKKFISWEISRGRQPHIIMSEFGDIDIDGLLINDNKIKLTTITGGCACCDLREELAEAFSNAVDASPGSKIFIESTGVGDPAGVIEAIRPVIQNGTALITAVIVVYDASRPLLSGKDSELARRQLQTADTIVVNKADIASRTDVQSVLSDISEINPTAELIVTSHGEIDVERALSGRSGVKDVEGMPSSSETFRSVGFQIEEPLSHQALEKWLKNLPPSVVRAKGFVELIGQEGVFEVQATRGQVSISRFNKGERPPAMLVLITHPMRTDGLVRRLQSCIVEAKN